MKERPILFSGAMVCALLAGTKTQTRRVLKLRPGFDLEERDDGRLWPWAEHPDHCDDVWMPCPYGEPCDRFWVRETFFAWGRWETRYSAEKGRDEWHFIDMTLDCGKAYLYAADGPRPQPLAGKRDGGVTPKWWKRPAIHMPRAASRITLEVTSVCVERLQSISEADAIAEGVEDVTKEVAPRDPEFRFWRRYRDGGSNGYTDNAIASYASLWTEINGPGSWEANPWVWAIEFRRLP